MATEQVHDPTQVDTTPSLEQALQAAGDPVTFLRSPRQWERLAPGKYAPPLIMPQLPVEFSTWEREQRAWREGVAVFDQTHHMTGLFLKGPDTLAFLSGLACNQLAGSTPHRAHQIIACNDDGYLVGDGILFHLDPGEFLLCGAPFAVNWVRYHAERTDLAVTATLDSRSPVYANGRGNTRPFCRYQIQGPNAWPLLEKLNGGRLEDVKFFHMTELNIAGHAVRGLRHGMAGAPGLEIWAPWELRDELLNAFVAAGDHFGLVLVGAHAYLSTAAESGWIPSPVPAIYSGEATKAYREWLPADEMEGLTRLSGSYSSRNVEDYYVTPYDLGYGHIVNLDHEFIGRDALVERGPASTRQKVTIVWNAEDTAKLLVEMLTPDAAPYKPLHLPMLAGDKTEMHYDLVTVGDDMVGTGHYTAYTANERAILTLATIHDDVKIGDEAIVHWGEAGGSYDTRTVDATAIAQIRGIVSPAPYSRVAREEYAPGRRSEGS